MVYALIFLFALFDALSTIVLVELGLAFEINPIVNFMLTRNPYYFLCVKMFATSVVLLWMYRWRYRPKVRLLSKATVCFYGLICVLHCVSHISAVTEHHLYPELKSYYE